MRLAGLETVLTLALVEDVGLEFPARVLLGRRHGRERAQAGRRRIPGRRLQPRTQAGASQSARPPPPARAAAAAARRSHGRGLARPLPLSPPPCRSPRSVPAPPSAAAKGSGTPGALQGGRRARGSDRPARGAWRCAGRGHFPARSAARRANGSDASRLTKKPPGQWEPEVGQKAARRKENKMKERGGHC
ncbi:taperin-like isoform X2 [Physeter macrocephalus]|uniref:Taperin-like isoform X2 n=1 Tax=Physeter macrocephalus TaxID=9755 RepID=A0A9W2WIE4_PHYMC|nr:taperin-like isoform X2 [Physeter catodon]